MLLYDIMRGVGLFFILWHEAMQDVAAALLIWATGADRRYVVRRGALALSWRVPPGELCLCDVRTANGAVLKTLSRGMQPVDVDEDTRSMKAFHARVFALCPSTRWGGFQTMDVAKTFLMERCAGYESTNATVAETVLLMAASARCEADYFEPVLTAVFMDFEEHRLCGDDIVCQVMKRHA